MRTEAHAGIGAHLREWSPSPVWPQGRGVFILRPMLEIGPPHAVAGSGMRAERSRSHGSRTPPTTTSASPGRRARAACWRPDLWNPRAPLERRSSSMTIVRPARDAGAGGASRPSMGGSEITQRQSDRGRRNELSVRRFLSIAVVCAAGAPLSAARPEA